MKGHVRKRGTKWCFVVDVGIDPITGRRKQKWFSGFKTKKEAEKAMVQKMSQLNTGSYVEPSKTPLKELLIRWLTEYVQVNCSPRTYEGYEYIVQKHIIPEIGNFPLDQLKPIHIQNYYSQKLAEGRTDGKGGLSHRSVLHHHRVLHEALEFSVKWRFMSINPVKATTPPKPQKKQFNVLNREKVRILLEGMKNSPFYEAIFLAINTGMRRGEIFGLRWRDVDFTNKTVSVKQTLLQLKNKGLCFRDTTKTDGSRRSIAVADIVLDVLKAVRKKQDHCKSTMESYYKDHNLVFANDDGTPVNINNVSKEFGRQAKKLDIPPIRLHDLRHTHATLLLQQGEHPKVVSERLGHSSISITMDVYSHVMPNMQKEAADKLSELLFGTHNH